MVKLPCRMATIVPTGRTDALILLRAGRQGVELQLYRTLHGVAILSGFVFYVSFDGHVRLLILNHLEARHYLALPHKASVKSLSQAYIQPSHTKVLVSKAEYCFLITYSIASFFLQHAEKGFYPAVGSQP